MRPPISTRKIPKIYIGDIINLFFSGGGFNEKGFKTSKKEYDGKGNLLEEKTYTYEYY